MPDIPAAASIRTRLSSSDAVTRRVAVRDITEADADEACAFLTLALQDSDATVRKEAADIIADFDPSEIVPVLTLALQHEDAEARSAAAQAMSGFDDAAIIPALQSALQSDNPAVIAAVLGVLRNFRGQAYTDAIPLLLKHDAAEVRREAVLFLGYLKDDTFIASLQTIALTDHDPQVRRAALGALQFSTSIDVTGTTLRALDDSHWQIRTDAAQALGKRGVQAIPHLRRVAVEDVWQVREKAVLALGALKAVEALETLVINFQSEVSHLRKAAIAAAGEIADATCLPLILAAGTDPDPEVRKLARWAESRVVPLCS